MYHDLPKSSTFVVSVHRTSVSQTQPLDMTLSTCTQLLWSPIARHVMSRICPVKLLYGLGHRAAAQFQDLDNLLIAYARAVQLIEIES